LYFIGLNPLAIPRTLSGNLGTRKNILTNRSKNHAFWSGCQNQVRQNLRSEAKQIYVWPVPACGF
jgi:hypothetical protein